MAPSTFQTKKNFLNEWTFSLWFDKLFSIFSLQVYKTAVTHYFSMKKARSHLGYSPKKYSLDGVVEHFKKTGHGKHRRRPSRLLYHIVNIIIGIIFVCLILGCLPRVDTSYISCYSYPSYFNSILVMNYLVTIKCRLLISASNWLV